MPSKKNFFADGSFRNVSIPNLILQDKWMSGDRLKVYIVLSNLAFLSKNKTVVTAGYVCRCLGKALTVSNKKNVNVIIRGLAAHGYISNDTVMKNYQRYHQISILHVTEIMFDDITGCNTPIECEEERADDKCLPWE